MMKEKRLMAELQSSNQYITGNVIFQFIKLLTNVVFIFTIGKVLQDTISGEFAISLTKAFILCGIMILIRFAATIGANRMSFKAIADVKKTLRDRLYEKLLKIGSSYHEHTATSEVVQVAAEGVEQLETYVGRYLPQLYYSMLAPLALFIIISTFSLKTAVILLICVPLIPFSIIAFQKIAKKIIGKYWNSYASLGDTFLENLQGLTTLKIYEADGMKHKKMNESAENFRIMTMKLLTMQLNSIVIMNIISFGGAAISIIVATIEFTNGNIVLWQAFAIIMLGADFFIPLRLLGSYFHVAMNGTTACAKLFKIIDFDENAKKSKETKQQQKDGNHEVEIENVVFAYGDNEPVLKNVSIQINQGEFVSIVGKSGCGKSTIAGLMMGHLTGYQGEVLLQGINGKNMTEVERMKKMTLVSHDSYIFKGTVRENLLMGDITATDDQLYAALDKVKLKDFVLAEGGLDYQILEQGGNISGGQKQRLAIARGILHNSDIYIFDEATSNIDVESENYIMDLIHQITGEKTIILITHRLANAEKSKRIYVMEQGVMKEIGKHEELMNKGTAYKEMYIGQFNLEQYGRGGVKNEH